MKTKLIAAALISSFGTLVAASGSAGASERWRYEFEKRQARHYELIREGRHDGTITWGEGHRLHREVVRVAGIARSYRADGYLDRSERQELSFAQDGLSQLIFQERNDHQKSPRWWRLAGY